MPRRGLVSCACRPTAAQGAHSHTSLTHARSHATRRARRARGPWPYGTAYAGGRAGRVVVFCRSSWHVSCGGWARLARVAVRLSGPCGCRVCPVPVAGVAPPGCRADHICAQRSAARAPRRARRFRGARIIWIQILRRERDWIQIPIRIPHSRFSNTNTSTLHWNWSAGSTLLRTPAIITSASRPLVAGVRMGMPPSAAAARR